MISKNDVTSHKFKTKKVVQQKDSKKLPKKESRLIGKTTNNKISTNSTRGTTNK